LKKIKKLLAVLLVALMIFSAFPITSFADTITPEPNSSNKTPVSINVFNVGTVTVNQNYVTEVIDNVEYKIYDIPDFTYIVTFSDGSTVTANYSDGNENLYVVHYQYNEPWNLGGNNHIYVSYLVSPDNFDSAATTWANVQLISASGYDYTLQDDFAYITGINSSSISENIIIPSEVDGYTVKGIYDLGVMGNSIKSLTVPGTVEVIRVENLIGLHNLQNIIVSENNKSYASKDGILYTKGLQSFLYCPTTKNSIIIPKETSAINGKLPKKVSVESGSNFFTSVNGVIYNAEKTKIIYANKTLNGAYTMPSTVKEIKEEAFSDCNKLTSVKFSNSVTSISYAAFCGCTALKTITLPTKLNTIKSSAFQSTAINTLTIPNTVTSIEEFAFDSAKIENIKLGTGLKTIGSYAFSRTPIKNITIPGNVKTIDSYAFFYCKKLTSLTLKNGIKKINTESFSNCASLKAVTIPNSVTHLGSAAFAFDSALTNVVIGSGITQINEFTFNCSGIKEIKIPDNVKYIYECSFRNCFSLKKLTIGSGLETIDLYAFTDCDKLTDITVSKANKKFTATNGMIYTKDKKTVYLAPSVSVKPTFVNTTTKIGDESFNSNSTVRNLTIPNTVTEIGYSAFWNCNNLTKVVIPKSIKTISRAAFGNCEKLISITIPKSVTKIDSHAFVFCKKLKNVYYAGTKSDWNKIKISDEKYYWTDRNGNKELLNAKIIYNSTGCKKHIYSAGADLTCNECGYFETGKVLRKVGSTWYYYNNGVKDNSNTLVKHTDGKWYHVNKGKRVNDTTMVKYNGTWYYVYKGVRTNANTTVKYDGRLRLIKNGKWANNTSTLYKSGNNLLYFKNGTQNNTNTLVTYKSKLYHVKGGKWVKDTAIFKYNGKRYYLKGGIVQKISKKIKVNGKYYNVKKGVVVK